MKIQMDRIEDMIDDMVDEELASKKWVLKLVY
jgi:hypothetical protein